MTRQLAAALLCSFLTACSAPVEGEVSALMADPDAGLEDAGVTPDAGEVVEAAVELPEPEPEPAVIVDEPVAPAEDILRRNAGALAQVDPREPLGAYYVLPAISRDGRLVAAARYHEERDSLVVELRRRSDDRMVRELPLPVEASEAGIDASVARLNAILRRRAFTTMAEMTPEVPEGEAALDAWDGGFGRWDGGGLSVRYDASTGGLAVYRDYRLVHQALVPAQVPNGPGVGLMGEEWAELPMIPRADRAMISADGSVIAIQLAACDCTCDIVPFWRVISL